MRISDWSSDVCSSDLIVCPPAQQAVEAAAEFRHENLSGVGWTHRGQAVGEADAGLEEGDLPVELDAVRVQPLARKAKAREDIHRENALDGQVVDGQDCVWAGARPGSKQRRDEAER